jgi:5-methylcytosine-specific restriction enzyme subunit McrC
VTGQVLTVREHARLTVDEIPKSSLDRAHISSSAFDWLCRLSAGFSAAGARLVEVENRRWLRLDNYVGVVETPCGTRIEILPKHVEEGQHAGPSRALLRRMICAALDLPVREAGPAALQSFEAPLSEWVIGRFLAGLELLVRQGLRFDYIRLATEQPFLRGQLDLARQMRQVPGKQHLFQLHQDTFTPDRPENRLLRLALDRVAEATREPEHWRLANELRQRLREVPSSTKIAEDFARWQSDRLMAHYKPVRTWCEMILHRHLPLALAGDFPGISMLFPMEKLFERYVSAWLAGALAPGASLTTQAARHHLCQHVQQPMFQLRPDLLLRHGARQWVMDTKWKLLKGDRSTKFDLSQSDFYQLFAYGHRYLQGSGDLFLVFPKNEAVDWPIAEFDFLGGLRLHVVPFNLESGLLERPYVGGLPLRTASELPPDS